MFTIFPPGECGGKILFKVFAKLSQPKLKIEYLLENLCKEVQLFLMSGKSWGMQNVLINNIIEWSHFNFAFAAVAVVTSNRPNQIFPLRKLGEK